MPGTPSDTAITIGIIQDDAKQTDTAIPIFSPHNLIGRTFLLDPDCNGNLHCAKLVEAIEGFDDNLEKNPTRIKFKCSINNEEFTDLIACSKVAEYISGTYYGNSRRQYHIRVHYPQNKRTIMEALTMCRSNCPLAKSLRSLCL